MTMSTAAGGAQSNADSVPRTADQVRRPAAKKKAVTATQRRAASRRRTPERVEDSEAVPSQVEDLADLIDAIKAIKVRL